MKKVKVLLILLARLPITLLVGLLRWDARYLRLSLSALWRDTRKFLGGDSMMIDEVDGKVSMSGEAQTTVEADVEE